MSVKKTIICDVEFCENNYTEAYENAGFPGWGHIVGLQNIKNGVVRETAHVCPECLYKIKQVLNGGIS